MNQTKRQYSLEDLLQDFLTNKITFKVTRLLKNGGGAGEEGVVSRSLAPIPSFHYTLTGKLVYSDCLISISAPDYNQVNIDLTKPKSGAPGHALRDGIKSAHKDCKKTQVASVQRSFYLLNVRALWAIFLRN